MVKKASVIRWAICTIIALIIVTNISTSTVTAVKTEGNTDYITSLAYANNNSLFIIGSAEDTAIPENFSVSDYIKYYKENMLGIPVCATFHRNLNVSESTILELKEQFDWIGVKLTINEDAATKKARVEFERWDKGRIEYDVYSFDISECPNEIENDNIVKIFDYQTSSYIIFVQDGKFFIGEKVKIG